MIVRCVRETLTSDELVQIDSPLPAERISFGVRLGSEYVVYGISMGTGGIKLDILDEEFEQIRPVPFILFEIVDGSVPPSWEMRTSGKGGAWLKPSQFFKYEDDRGNTANFEVDLAEGVPAALKVFTRLQEGA